MPHVEVRDARGALVHTYEIIVAEYGTLIDDEDLIDMAKCNALEDELTTPERMGELSFGVVHR